MAQSTTQTTRPAAAQTLTRLSEKKDGAKMHHPALLSAPVIPIGLLTFQKLGPTAVIGAVHLMAGSLSETGPESHLRPIAQSFPAVSKAQCGIAVWTQAALVIQQPPLVGFACMLSTGTTQTGITSFSSARSNNQQKWWFVCAIETCQATVCLWFLIIKTTYQHHSSTHTHNCNSEIKCISQVHLMLSHHSKGKSML